MISFTFLKVFCNFFHNQGEYSSHSQRPRKVCLKTIHSEFPIEKGGMAIRKFGKIYLFFLETVF